MTDTEGYKFFEEEDPIRTAAEQADDKLRGVLSRLTKWRSVVMLAAMALVTLVLPLISTEFVNPISIEFLFTALYSLALAMLSYYMFIPNGTNSERKESRTYAKAVAWWMELSKQVREGGFIMAFYRFCTVRREEERAERKALFVEAAGIPMSIYEERYAGLTPKQLCEKRKEGELTGKQVKYLKAANGEINILPINPSMILSGLEVPNINDVGRQKRGSILGWFRPLTLIVTMLVRSLIHIGGNEDVVFVDYITQIATDIFIILIWAFNGFRYGVSRVREEELVVKGRSEFISLFLERAKREQGAASLVALVDGSDAEKPEGQSPEEQKEKREDPA